MHPLGLSEGGKCPECGLPLADSFDPQRLILSDKNWVRKLARGISLVYLSIWIAAGGSLAVALVMGIWLGSLVTLAMILFIIIIIASLVFFLRGVALLAAKERGAHSLKKASWSKWEKRLLWLTVGLSILPVVGAAMGPGIEMSLFPMAFRVGYFCEYIAGFLFFRHLAQIACRLPDFKLSWYLRICA